jgi:N-methylhydantoinase B
MLGVREIYAEGVRIPPVFVARGGAMQEDILKLITLNMRNPTMRYLDFARQYGSCQLGIRRIQGLYEKYGRTVFLETLSMCLDYTERRLRAVITDIPDGTYRADDWVEIDGIRTEPLRIAVTLKVHGDSLTIDLEGSDRQISEAGFNAPWGPTYAMALYVMKCIAGSDIPFNQAVERVISVHAPSGCVFNVTSPTACGGVVGGAELVSRLTEVILAAFSQAVPGRVVAGTGPNCLVTLHGIDSDPERSELFGRVPGVTQVFLPFEVHRPGFGARPHLDGVSGSAPHLGNDVALTAEEIETRAPVRVRCYEIREESAGAGRTRGGFGVRRTYEVLADVTAAFMVGHSRTHPYGIFGGSSGLPARMTVTDREGETREVGWAESLALRAGDTITTESPGGGGYGFPWERDAEDVLLDVQHGYYGPETSRDVYGVVIDGSGTIDVQATEAARGALAGIGLPEIDRGPLGPFSSIDASLRHRWAVDRT